MKPIERKTHTIDATGQTMGRMATRAAVLIMGKHKATYSPHIDGGDSVVITNITRSLITGQKLLQKEYKHYSGYPGGMKTTRPLAHDPKKAFRLAVSRMLPKNKLRQHMIKRLIVE